MRRDLPRIGAELTLVLLVLASVGGTLTLVMAMHRRQVPSPKPPVVASVPEPVAPPKPRPKPLPPPAPPEDPTPKALADLAAAERAERDAITSAGRRADALEQGRREALSASARWRRREMLVKSQIASLDSRARKIEDEADALVHERDALALERDATKGDLDRARMHASAADSFAILPYKGPNGTWRRPIPIECRDGTATLMPHGPSFSMIDLMENLGGSRHNPLVAAIAVIAAKLENRTGPDGAPVVPYLLFLVRPDGIRPFYAARALLEPLGVAFGYELVDQEWEIDYPDFGDPSTWGSPSPSTEPTPWPRPRHGSPYGGGGEGTAPRERGTWGSADVADGGGLGGGIAPGGDGRGPGPGGARPLAGSGSGAGNGNLGFGSPRGDRSGDFPRGNRPGDLTRGDRPGGLPRGDRPDGGTFGGNEPNPGGVSLEPPVVVPPGAGDASVVSPNPSGPAGTGLQTVERPGSTGAEAALGMVVEPGSARIPVLQPTPPSSSSSRPGTATGNQAAPPDVAPSDPSSSSSAPRPGQSPRSVVMGSPSSGARGDAGSGIPAPSGARSSRGSGRGGSLAPGVYVDHRPDETLELVIACGPKGVTVQPGGYRFSALMLDQKDGVLPKALRTIVNARQAAVPGVTVRPELRYLVESGGESMYWKARKQTALAGLGWPTSLRVAEGEPIRSPITETR